MPLEKLFQKLVVTLTERWQAWVDLFGKTGIVQPQENAFYQMWIDLDTRVETFYRMALVDSAYEIYLGDDEMAKKFDMEFVNYTLTEKDAVTFEKWLKELQKQDLDPATELLMMGFKVSARYVGDQNAVVTTLIGTDETPDNQGACMSSWSETLYEGFAMCLFKHSVIFSGKTWSTGHTPKRWG